MTLRPLSKYRIWWIRPLCFSFPCFDAYHSRSEFWNWLHVVEGYPKGERTQNNNASIRNGTKLKLEWKTAYILVTCFLFWQRYTVRKDYKTLWDFKLLVCWIFQGRLTREGNFSSSKKFKLSHRKIVADWFLGKNHCAKWNFSPQDLWKCLPNQVMLRGYVEPPNQHID